MRSAQRLAAVQWHPGTQNGRPVRVAFTVPVTFTPPNQLPSTPAPASGDSLDLPQFNKLKVATDAWNLRTSRVPAGQSVFYGSCVGRPASHSAALVHSIRLVNLTTGQVFRISVKPGFTSRPESSFCYCLPAGRYALSQYEYGEGTWYGAKMFTERVAKPLATGTGLAARRYCFTLAAGQLHYVGTWNLTTANAPRFLDEKAVMDGTLKPSYRAAVHLDAARVAVPQ